MSTDDDATSSTENSGTTIFPKISWLPPPSYLGISLGVGLNLFLLSRCFPSFKPLTSAVKFADSAIKVPKAIKRLNPTSPSSLYSASKALFKGYKTTTEILPPSLRRLKLKVSLGSLSSKQIKALFSTASLVRYAVSPFSSDGFLLLNLLKYGYKVSKNFTKVLEGFVGLQIDSTISSVVDALGIMVKTAGVVKEVTFWLAIGFCSRGTSFNYCLLESKKPRHELCLCYQGSPFATDVFNINNRLSHVCFGELKEKSVVDGNEFDRELGFSISELLSLAVPVHEILSKSSV